jgi:hypothetical protein
MAPEESVVSAYFLHSISQVGADVWHEMYEGVHGRAVDVGRMFNPEYFSFQVAEIGSPWREELLPGVAYLARLDRLDLARREAFERAEVSVPRLLPDVGHVHRDDFDGDVVLTDTERLNRRAKIRAEQKAATKAAREEVGRRACQKKREAERRAAGAPRKPTPGTTHAALVNYLEWLEKRHE